MRSAATIALLLAACTSTDPTPDPISLVQTYREVRASGDVAAEAELIAPGARRFFEEKKGEGEPLTAGKGGAWGHWDDYFHSETKLTGWKWRADGGVEAIVLETNDFYRLLDWKPNPYRMVWWLDAQGRIRENLIQRIPGQKVESRMDEFKAWARQKHPDELRYLMPNDRIDPTGDRPERWRKILDEWRAEVGLPAV